LTIRPLDAAGESAGRIDNTARLIEPGEAMPSTERPAVDQPAPRAEVLESSVKAATSQPKPKPITASVTRQTRGSVPKPTIDIPPFKKLMIGLASWYDNGTTAMRMPRGTHIKICGAMTCIYRVVRDWGPASYLSNRIVDMTPSDFVTVTGKSLGAGLAPVKVYIY
jgi:hypothetical protein